MERYFFAVIVPRLSSVDFYFLECLSFICTLSKPETPSETCFEKWGNNCPEFAVFCFQIHLCSRPWIEGHLSWKLKFVRLDSGVLNVVFLDGRLEKEQARETLDAISWCQPCIVALR